MAGTEPLKALGRVVDREGGFETALSAADMPTARRARGNRCIERVGAFVRRRMNMQRAS
jgi:hypothetical protein